MCDLHKLRCPGIRLLLLRSPISTPRNNARSTSSIASVQAKEIQSFLEPASLTKSSWSRSPGSLLNSPRHCQHRMTTLDSLPIQSWGYCSKMHTGPLRFISPSSQEKLTRASRAKMQTLSQNFERIHDPVSSTRKRCSSAESHETFHGPIAETHINQPHRCSMFPVDHPTPTYTTTPMRSDSYYWESCKILK